MDTKELTRSVEYAEQMASELSAHCTLFDGYYDGRMGLEQANLEPDVFWTSWSAIFRQVDELYGFLKTTLNGMQSKRAAKETV